MGSFTSDKKIRIVLLSKSKLFLGGLRKVLEFETDIEVAAETSGTGELNTCIKEYRPKAVFIDNREGEHDIQKLLRSKIIRSGNIKTIVFTDRDAIATHAPNLINVNHETSTSELIRLIRNGSDKETRPEKLKLKELELAKITRTEARIIKLIAAGVSNKAIAEKLSISDKTVKAHITNIFEKLHIQNRYQLMVFGRRNKKNIELSV
ncbi:MAG: response regulator transcription factor [Thermodesulfobacteriota bacterium]